MQLQAAPSLSIRHRRRLAVPGCNSVVRGPRARRFQRSLALARSVVCRPLKFQSRRQITVFCCRSQRCMAVDRLLLMLYIITGQRALPSINASLLNCFFSTPVSRSTGMDRLGNVRNQQNADSLTRPSSQRSPPFP